MENNVKKKNNSGIIIAVLCILLLASTGFICYDKFLKKEDKECPKIDCQCEKNGSNFNNETSIKSLSEINFTGEYKTVRIGNRNIKIQVDEDSYLLIDDNYVYGSNNSNKIVAMHTYLTDKFVFFTDVGQDGEVIEYAVGENGAIVVNDNDYQMMNFKLNNGYLQASGHIFCGLDGDCPDKDLIIKLEGNVLTVEPFE